MGKYFILYVVDAVLFSLCAIIWLYQGIFGGPDWFDIVLGLVWLAGAAVWTTRAVKEARQRKNGDKTSS